jgi:putative intracellular protease/amidase
VRLGVDAQLVGDEEADAIVLPGGAGGAERLAADERVRDMLRRFEKEERWIGAICAAPSVLVAAEVGAGKTMTSHPSVREQVEAFAGSYVEDAVAFDPKIVTSRGPGTAFDFALDLVGLLFGAAKAGEVRTPMIFSCRI